jgi:hypothetical protein
MAILVLSGEVRKAQDLVLASSYVAVQKARGPDMTVADLMLQLLIALDLHALLEKEGLAQAGPRLLLAAAIVEAFGQHIREAVENDSI